MPKRVLAKSLSARRKVSIKGKFPHWILVILEILGCLILISIILIIRYFYPMKPDTKDWLDIFSAFGDGAGVLVIAALVIDVYRWREDRTKKKTPEIMATAQFIRTNTIPNINARNVAYCFMEMQQPDKSTEEQDDYQTFYTLIKHDTATHFLRIDLSNRQVENDGDAKKVELYIELTLFAGDAAKADPKMVKFWCPRNSKIILPARSNNSEKVMILCGLPIDSEYTHIQARILEIRCTNLAGAPYNSLNMPILAIDAEKLSYTEFLQEQ